MYDAPLFSFVLAIDTLERILHLFAIGFASTDQVLEENNIIYDFKMARKEGAIISNSDTIDMLISHQMLAICYLLDIIGRLNFLNDALHGFQHLAGKFADRLLEALGIVNLHTPSQF